MEVLRDNSGDYEIRPIDFFQGTVSVADWIKEKPSKDDIEFGPDGLEVERLIDRAALFGAAREAYYKAAGVMDLNNLRDEPMVCTNYDFSVETSPNIHYWFLFKEDNNGNTYRVYHGER